ncbi:hypothetical protein [Streptomyces phaeofaciens]|uniref:hypothetical protein n=1 Tax=Streptomyces phaeofaciens TaxID=68254 RepID=UPI00369D5FCC
MAESAPSWPDGAAFDKAVQLSAFPPHGRLDAAVVERNGGLMRRMEGANAVAYVLRTPEGALVLRCFKDTPTPALRRRYEELEKRAARAGGADAGHPWVLADARWLDEAVRVDGRWWPAVVMEHVAGESLRAHLEAHAGRREELTLLAGRWREVLARLDGHGLAHGDLQHDNVRIADGGRIRLIDLDAVWTAEFAGEPPRECGHPHFQHPERFRHPERLPAGGWDREIDRFSALVIQVSILALAVDPGLWDDFHNEDNLLFTAADFARPMDGPLWFRLAASRSVEVRRLTALLDAACRGSLGEVPSFRVLDVPEPPLPPAGSPLTLPLAATGHGTASGDRAAVGAAPGPIDARPPRVPAAPDVIAPVPAPGTVPVPAFVHNAPPLPPTAPEPAAPAPSRSHRPAYPGPFAPRRPLSRPGSPPARAIVIGAGVLLFLLLIALLVGVVL